MTRRKHSRKGRKHSEAEDMDASIGVNLRVTAHSNQGGRKYMEDMFCVAYQPTADEKDLLYAYFGIFDGHGGREAALYAKTHLMDHIVSQKNFWSEDDDLVLRSIKDGFVSVHQAMWRELDKWPKTQSGLPSTSGTTASVAFVRRGKLYLGHVGDSGIVLGYQDPNSNFWKARPLTLDHKPENPAENARIQGCGGKVVSKSGVPRVVWNRPRIGHKGPVRRSTMIDEIPFLAVARSLGDLWSYNSEQDEFVVSPVPDTAVIDIDVNTHRCLILGSDGLWNMLSAQDAVNSVYFAEKNNERQNQIAAQLGQEGAPSHKNWINPSKRLVDRALDRWYSHNLRADNTSVVTVVIDPPGPPKVQKPTNNRHSTSPISPEKSSPMSRLSCVQSGSHGGMSLANRLNRVIAQTRYANNDKHSPPRTIPSQYPNRVHSPHPESSPQPILPPRFPVGKPNMNLNVKSKAPGLAMHRPRQHPSQPPRVSAVRGKRTHPALVSKTSRVMQARAPAPGSHPLPATASTSNLHRVAGTSPAVLSSPTMQVPPGTIIYRTNSDGSEADSVQINEVSSSCEVMYGTDSAMEDSIQAMPGDTPESRMQRKGIKTGKLRMASAPGLSLPSHSSAGKTDKGRKRSSRQSGDETDTPNKMVRMSSGDDDGSSTGRRTESERLVMENQIHVAVSKLRNRTREIRSRVPMRQRKSVVRAPVLKTVSQMGSSSGAAAKERKVRHGNQEKATKEASPPTLLDVAPNSRIRPTLQRSQRSATPFPQSSSSDYVFSPADNDVNQSGESSDKGKSRKEEGTGSVVSPHRPLNQKNARAVSLPPNASDVSSRAISLRTQSSRDSSLINTISLQSSTLKKTKPVLKRLQQGKKPGSSAKDATISLVKKSGDKKPGFRTGNVHKQGKSHNAPQGRNLRSADIPPRATRNQNCGKK